MYYMHNKATCIIILCITCIHTTSKVELTDTYSHFQVWLEFHNDLQYLHITSCTCTVYGSLSSSFSVHLHTQRETATTITCILSSYHHTSVGCLERNSLRVLASPAAAAATMTAGFCSSESSLRCRLISSLSSPETASTGKVGIII